MYASRTVVAMVAIAMATFPAQLARAQSHTHHGGGLPHRIPDFCAGASVVSRQSGEWGSGETWSTGRPPAAGERVLIAPGTTVTVMAQHDEAVGCVAVEGLLRFATDRSSRLVVGTLMVMPEGTLEMGRADAPVAADATAELLIAPVPIDTAADPEQYGTGLLAFGTVSMHGAPRTTTFLRLAAEPLAGHTSLTLEAEPQGWQPGDRLVLPDTRHLQWNQIRENYRPQWEYLTVAQVQGRVVQLATPLKFGHRGARNLDGKLEFLPHVGNLTRNVIVRSQNPGVVRGHTLFTHRAKVDIRYASFQDLGRTTVEPLASAKFDSAGNPVAPGTNQLGRYAIHLHHLMGPAGGGEFQYRLVGNAIERTSKWGIAIHSTHFGLVKDNVVADVGGAGIATEDGTESFNVIDHNFVVNCYGKGGRASGGREGIAFWFRGPNNYVRNNVAANARGSQAEAAYGYEYLLSNLKAIRIPKVPGADLSDDSQFEERNANAMPLLEFANNEVYGATESGMTFWWLGAQADNPMDSPISVIRDLRIWHVYNMGIYQYQAHRVHIDGLVVRGANYDSSACCQWGYYAGDYFGKDITLSRVDIQGMKTGIAVPLHAGNGVFTVTDAYLRNGVNVLVTTPWTVAADTTHIKPRTTVLRNVRHAAVPGKPLVSVKWQYNPKKGSSPIVLDRTFVIDHNGQRGESFQVFSTAQAPEAPTPEEWREDWRITRAGAPVSGISNAKNWAAHRIAVGGQIAACSTTRPGFVGAFTCPVGGDVPVAPLSPPSPPTGVRIEN